jgi:hypothetical protein
MASAREIGKVNLAAGSTIGGGPIGGGGSSPEELLATVSSIDLTSTGTTTLYTVPGGENYIITKVLLMVQTASGVTITPAAGVGIAAGEDDIFASQSMLGLTTTNKVFTFQGLGTSEVANATDVVKLGIDTAADGTLTAKAFIFGVETSL